MSELKPELPPFQAVTAFDLHTINAAFQQLYNVVWSFHREDGLVNPEGTPALPTPDDSVHQSFRATLSSSWAPSSYTTLIRVDDWVEDYSDTAFTLTANRDLVINQADRYFLGYNVRILAESPYSASYFQSAMYHTPISTGTPGLLDSMAVNTEIDGNVIARGNGAAQSTVVDLAAGDIIDLRCRNGQVTYDHHLEANGTTLLAIKLGTSGEPEYKIHTQPAVYASGLITVYTGFTTATTPDTSAAEWAVKKQLSTGSETWAGKTTFDEILDDYLSLTYT